MEMTKELQLVWDLLHESHRHVDNPERYDWEANLWKCDYEHGHIIVYSPIDSPMLFAEDLIDISRATRTNFYIEYDNDRLQGVFF